MSGKYLFRKGQKSFIFQVSHLKGLILSKWKCKVKAGGKVGFLKGQLSTLCIIASFSRLLNSLRVTQGLSDLAKT